jgi:hypothetical protein
MLPISPLCRNPLAEREGEPDCRGGGWTQLDATTRIGCLGGKGPQGSESLGQGTEESGTQRRWRVGPRPRQFRSRYSLGLGFEDALVPYTRGVETVPYTGQGGPNLTAVDVFRLYPHFRKIAVVAFFWISVSWASVRNDVLRT